MIDLRKHFAGSGFLIVDSAHDTTNLICRYGHIYSNGEMLIASLDGWVDDPRTKGECTVRSRGFASSARRFGWRFWRAISSFRPGPIS